LAVSYGIEINIPCLFLSRRDLYSPQLVVRTATDYIVVFNAGVSLTGQFVKVKITKTSPLTLFGELKTQINTD